MANTVKCRNCAVLLLPSPLEVVQAFVKDFPLLMEHAKVTLTEGFLGLTLGVVIGFVAAVLMDHFQGFYKAFYPIMVITQTIPTIAIAPLLVLWMGYEMAPKVTLIVIVTFSRSQSDCWKDFSRLTKTRLIY